MTVGNSIEVGRTTGVFVGCVVSVGSGIEVGISVGVA